MKNDGKHITEYQRYKIEGWLEDGISVAVISERLGKCVKTVYNEIKRGTVTFLDTELREYEKYCADVAQMKYDMLKKNKGRRTYISENDSLCEYISDMILHQKLSPYCISEYLKQTRNINV